MIWITVLLLEAEQAASTEKIHLKRFLSSASQGFPQTSSVIFQGGWGWGEGVRGEGGRAVGCEITVYQLGAGGQGRPISGPGMKLAAGFSFLFQTQLPSPPQTP